MDKQLTGLAGEYFVAAELLKREYQVAMTVGNAKAVDLLVHDPRRKRSLAVEVKTLRANNCFSIKLASIVPDQMYVFVILHDLDVPPEYFVLLRKEVLKKPKHYFGTSIGSSRETVNIGPLKEWKNRWDLFE